MSISEYNALPEQVKSAINLETFESLLSRGWIAINGTQIYITDEGRKAVEYFSHLFFKEE